MSRAEDRAERQDRLLDEMADLAMDLARDMAAEAKQAESPEERERCILAFDRMARSARLSIGLQRRLARDDARERSRRQAEAVDLRKAQLRARLRSEIKAGDYGFKDSLDLERELDERIAEDALYQSFLALPLDEAITGLRDKLDLPDPPPGRSPIEGEGDREAVEGGEERGFAIRKADAIDNDLSIAAKNAHPRLSGLQPPRPAAPGAPPEGEQLDGADLKPGPKLTPTSSPGLTGDPS